MKEIKKLGRIKDELVNDPLRVPNAKVHDISIEKINELIDAVNELQVKVEKLNPVNAGGTRSGVMGPHCGYTADFFHFPGSGGNGPHPTQQLTMITQDTEALRKEVKNELLATAIKKIEGKNFDNIRQNGLMNDQEYGFNQGKAAALEVLKKLK